ncbi:MAG: transcriptional activator NhaR [Myxococcota bacterium]
MAWLNYHHLLYFWTVARLGTIAAASKELLLSQPTISTQLKTLEESLGQKLFQRQGRRLVLTEVGRTAFRYADDIFRLGRELQETLARGGTGTHVRLTVGVVDVIPKLVAERMLEPAFEAVPELQLEVEELPLPQLLARLAVHELDVVLADQPAPPDVKVRAFSHKLGQSGMTVFGVKRYGPLAKRFPQSLDGQPMLFPKPGSALRADLDAWLQRKGVSPRMVGEFDDSALMKVFGDRGRGLFFAPTAIEDALLERDHLQVIGRIEDVRQAYYAISVERRLNHPAVVAIAEKAREDLLG